MTKEQLMSIINTAYSAVQESLAGPIMSTADDGKPIIHYLGQHTFIAILGRIVPTDVNTVIGDKKEDWEGE